MNVWGTVDTLAINLRAAGVSIDHQILVIGEEYGEVVKALFGVQGSNPRKGVTHTDQDLAQELADVAITALVAIKMFGYDPAAMLADKLSVVEDNYAQVFDG